MKLSALRPLLLLVFALWQSGALAEDFKSRFGAEPYEADSTKVRALTVKVGALDFFKDNEFDGNVVKGYSLPGFRLQPRLAYCPIPQISMELGVHATIYEGANKYPSYVFHDIAKWKGSQYQRGAHALPFFRAAAHLHRPGGSRVTIAVGDIYGGATHSLLIPLYNPELLLTDDPEAGAQVLVDRPLWHSDVWVNWQSYIFEESTHQEAFTVGWAQRISLLDTSLRSTASPCPTASPRPRHRLGIPLQLLVQHRGGEQDKGGSVQTLCNGAAGVGLRWNVGHKVVRHVDAEVLALGYAQQAGTLWPFKGGYGVYTKVDVGLNYGLHVRMGYFRANKFITLLGSPYFGAVSTKTEGACYPDHPQTAHLALDYSRTFGKHYALGAKVETFCNAPGRMRLADGTMQNTTTTFNTSFGIYLRLNPSFLLKKF